MIARTRKLLGLAPLPRPAYRPNVRQPVAEVAPPRETLPKRHHPNLDATAIRVRKASMELDDKGLCFCCEDEADAWLCADCAERGCGGGL